MSCPDNGTFQFMKSTPPGASTETNVVSLSHKQHVKNYSYGCFSNHSPVKIEAIELMEITY
ncbi:MAG TPA: hypothetical protein DHV69_04745 [Sphaerochaeta sp.]|nr:MAG: hypothetical protein A2Y31_09525 [Spirochaetes bacterium GWC2_52_13]PKL22407.1 MAG: hypothetical protein CVV48_02885 [Spirochaetae bacterium HGW-Spirochaetae-4]HCG63187.1 hypothetical protein [Sphaerochaeta sp.]HCJ94524.1 hypothetical protein [Sphaerochaeta sp.]HCS36276.1 hypothetical protein [Sphaerochaeta sp.]